jgi:hypothetical protein
MQDLRCDRLQVFVDVLTTANFDSQAWRLHIATKYSRVDLNLVMLELIILVLSHKYTDQDKQYPTVPDLPGMLQNKKEGQELVGFTFCIVRHAVCLSVSLDIDPVIKYLLHYIMLQFRLVLLLLLH